MWLITQHGFYSLVRDRENATRFLVRARVRKDLLNLKSLAGLEAEVQSNSEREYPFQLRVDERELPRIMNALGNTIDYPSFTARVAQRIDQACRTLLYGEVFNTLRSIYDPSPASQLRRPAASTPSPAQAPAAPSAQPSSKPPALPAPSESRQSTPQPDASAGNPNKQTPPKPSDRQDELSFDAEPPPPPRRTAPLNIRARLARG